MTNGIVYNNVNGEIVQSVTVPTPKELSKQARAGQGVIEFSPALSRVRSREHFIDLGSKSVTPRAAMNPSVSTSTGQAEITNLPDPCEIRWGRQSAEATGGSATITFDEPGTYTLTLRADPQYLEQTLEVDIP